MKVLDNGNEVVSYNFEGYQAYVREGRLSHYPNYAADSHWHDDVEFICVHSGSMQYRVNDHTITLHAGEGIFVNSRQLHYGYSDAREECDFLCVLLHPDLLCGSERLRRSFVQPLLQGGQPYALLTPSSAWQAEVMKELLTMAARREHPAAPLYIQQSFARIWLLLWQHTPHNAMAAPDHRLDLVKIVVAMIQARYTERITLEDMAKSASISKSTCLNLFRIYMNDTPGHYLIAYRLKQAAILLTDTDRGVADIALSVGFSSPSHFGEAFRQIYGVSPRAYRAAAWQSSAITPE